MNTAHLRMQLGRLWDTRPVRPSSPRTIAGVCAGIAGRYRIDPTLVKVAFVVAAVFGGSGLILYVAAWIVFPSSTGARARAERSHGGHAHGWFNNPTVILWVVIVIVASSVLSRGPWGSGGVVGGLLMLVGWWLLFLRTPEPPAGTSVTTVAIPESPQRFVRWTPRAVRTGAPVAAAAATATGARAAAAAVPTDTGARAAAAAVRTDTVPTDTVPTDTVPTETGPTDFLDATPPSWDPLGAARFAWDLPEPTTPQPPPVTYPRHPRRSAFSFVVLGLAILVVAGGVAANALGADWFTTAHVLSLALAVIGAGLLVNGLRRHTPRSHPGALAPLAIGLSAAVIVTTLLTTWGPDDHRLGMPAGGIGDRNWKPLSQNDIRDEYTLSTGSMTLDLRDITLAADDTVHLRNGIGEIVVKVPAGMNVRANCSAGAGDYTCPEGLDGGADGTGGPVLTIDAHTNVGSVEIKR
ncbi:PspC domain-containing protein [Gordonia sp. DT219]|uniref:PspC domain-containing protein n=1 Tax=Gordonia sp. DT219 TaxID=3416658 RepID=UPI003CF2D8FD